MSIFSIEIVVGGVGSGNGKVDIELYAPYVAMFVSVLVSTVSVFLSAKFTLRNFFIQNERKKSDISTALIAELNNLARHYGWSSLEIGGREIGDISGYEITKYSNGNLIMLKLDELILLDRNLCADIMQIAMYTRNNDIYIKNLIAHIEACKDNSRDELHSYVRNRVDVIKNRFIMSRSYAISIQDKIVKSGATGEYGERVFRDPVVDMGNS